MTQREMKQRKIWKSVQAPNVRVNYAHVPPTLPVQRSIVPPGEISHIRPVPGGVNAVLTVTWRATSPLLCGGEGVSKEYRFLKRKKGRNGRPDAWKSEPALIKRTLPLKNGDGGKYTLSGTALAGMIRSVLKVGTGSVYTPINENYKGNFGAGLDRGKYPITSSDINLTAQSSDREDRIAALSAMKGCSSAWQTIAQVADRSYLRSCHDTVPIDCANAMMGFVLGTDEQNGEHTKDQWRARFDKEIAERFPQGLTSRISFGFADCITLDPELWPMDQTTALKITGANPKVSFYPSYLAQGAWNDHQARLAGLKVYPIHDPDLDLKNWAAEDAVFENLGATDRGELENELGDSDTLLHFLKADQESFIEFTGDITCHNLDRCEFGALVWALFLGDNPLIGGFNEDLRHNLGHLRGFGMGQLAPVLSEVSLCLNPTEVEPKPQEFDGEQAVELMRTCLGEFLETDIARATKDARTRLLFFKSRTIGAELLRMGRLKRFKKGGGSDGNDFTRLKNIGFRLDDLDNEIAEECWAQGQRPNGD